jgi:hypothetical protein
MIIERPNRKLGKLAICQKGKPSAAATARYLEIIKNVELD